MENGHTNPSGETLRGLRVEVDATPPRRPGDAELFAAIGARDPDEVRALLAVNPTLAHARDEQGLPAILVARYRYEPEILAALLAVAGALDLYEAAVVGDAARIRALAAADHPDIDAYSADGFTPLQLAAYFSEPDAVAALIELGANPRAWTTGEAGMQALHLAATRPRNGAVCRLLVGAGADVNAQQERGGYSPLHRAAQGGDEETARALLELGADPLVEADDGLDAIQTAIACDHDALAALLRGA